MVTHALMACLRADPLDEGAQFSAMKQWTYTLYEMASNRTMAHEIMRTCHKASDAVNLWLRGMAAILSDKHIDVRAFTGMIFFLDTRHVAFYSQAMVLMLMRCASRFVSIDTREVDNESVPHCLTWCIRTMGIIITTGWKTNDCSFLLLALEHKFLVLIFRLLFRRDHWDVTSSWPGEFESVEGDIVSELRKLLSTITCCALRGSVAVIRYVKRSLRIIEYLYSTGRFMPPGTVPAGSQCKVLIEDWETHHKEFKRVVGWHSKFINQAGEGCFGVRWCHDIVYPCSHLSP
jgi:hypothetical protein